MTVADGVLEISVRSVGELRKEGSRTVPVEGNYMCSIICSRSTPSTVSVRKLTSP